MIEPLGVIEPLRMIEPGDLAQARRKLCAADLLGSDDEHGVVSGDRPDDAMKSTAIQRGADHVSRTGRCAEEHEIARRRHLDDPVSEDPAQVRTGCDLLGRQFRQCVYGISAGYPDLDRAQFLEVPRDSGLSCLDPVRGEQFHELFLGADGVMLEKPADAMLALGLSRHRYELS
jgi:hypothetical protein